MDEKDLTIQELRAKNKKITEELKQLKKQMAAVDTDMDKLTTEMMEYICDNQCKHPYNAEDQEELEDICAECKMGKFVCDILNTYNHQSKQLEEFKENNLDPIEMCKVAIALDKLKEYQRLEEQGLLLKLPCKVGDTVYVIQNNADACSDCGYFVVGHCMPSYCSKHGDFEYPQHADRPVCEKHFYEVCKIKMRELEYIVRNIDEFGKTIFLTEQEAQSALEKIKGE